VLTGLARQGLGIEKVGADFLQFWTAGRLLASGRSPYDVDGQAQIHKELGWKRDVEGLGLYDFLPYYYPPWLGMVFVPLLPLGYNGAKLAWLFLNVNFMLRVPVVLVPTFALSVLATLMGQTPPLILFLTALTWFLLQKDHDLAAGAALAGLTVKPQLSVLLIVATLLWSARRRRWGVGGGFLATLAFLGLASAVVVPSWPIQMLRAPVETPLPSEHFPWIGLSWLLVLRSCGLRSWTLGLLYGVVAIPVVVAVARAAWSRSTALGDLVAMSLLAVPFFAPYCQCYDLPILLIPFLVLLGHRLPDTAGAALVIVLILVPYPHLVLIDHIRLGWLPPKPPPFFTFFWIPLLIGGAWLATAHRAGRTSSSPEASA
jgi:hypothetical protein